MKSTKGESIRFLVAGSINTLATYLGYLALLSITSYPIAFTLSFVGGIFIAYGVNSLYVFKTPLSRRKMFQYPVIYAFHYGLGILLLAVLVDGIGVDKRIAPLMNIVVLAPLIFMLNKWFLLKQVKR
jgi:putative flippase GtrA